jgi:hypothetical protein
MRIASALETFPNSQLRRQAIAVVVEQEQRVVADYLEVAVVGTAFLLPMDRALAGIHVEDDAVYAVQRLGLSDHVAVHGHQPHEVFFTGQELGLEPMQRRRQCCASVPDLRRTDQAKRRVRREAWRVIEVLIPGQAAVDRLPQ